MNNSTKAAQMFLKDDYERLLSFFKKTWEDPSANEKYLYRVYLAQKCFNLNELFFRAAFDEAGGEERARLADIRKKTFVSQTGFVMQAGILSKYYKEHKKFPKILICDELLKTGHDFMEVLTSVSQAIVEECYGCERTDLNTIWTVYAKLLDSVVYFSYMQSKEDPRLLSLPNRSAEKGKLNWENPTSASDWFSFVQNSSASIVFSGTVENTTFIPSFWIPESCYKQLADSLKNQKRAGWSCELWRFWNKSAVIWQRSCYNINNEPYMQQTLRCSFNAETREYAITPYLFWTALKDGDNERLFARLATLLGKYSSMQTEVGPGVFGALIAILTCKKQYARDIRSQLVLTLASLLLYCGAVKDAEFNEVEQIKLLTVRSDLNKVAECFGTPGQISLDFETLLCRNAALLRTLLWEAICNHLLVAADQLCERTFPDPDHGKDLYCIAACEHLLAVDTRQQKQIQYRKDHQIQYGAATRYYESDGFLPDYLDSFPKDYTSIDKKIGALMILLMWGVTGTAIHRRKEGNVNEFSEIYLNVGESTQIPRAMNLLQFVPALRRIEHICQKEYFSPRNMICRFGNYLDNKYHSNDYAQAFIDFYDWCRDTGRTLSDWIRLSPIWLTQPNRKHEVRTVQEWNKKPWKDNVWADSGKMDMQDYLRWEEQQRNHYYEEAGHFLFDG